MLHLFRKFFHSTGGIFAALGLIVMLALAFAAGDVANLTSSAGLGSGDRVAQVGSTKIGTAQLAKQAQQALEVARQQTPGLTMKALLAAGGLQQVLDQMIDEEAQVAFGREHGVIAGKRLIDSELAKIPAFQGAGGKFDENTYRSVLAQRQLNDADVRDSFARELVARQLLAPVKLGAVMPKGPVLQYAALLREQRNGAIGILPAAAFAPKGEPTPADIAAWYAAHKAAYTIPERRVIRYALFDDSAVRQVAAPTDAEIAARYAQNKAQYAASESRKVSQLIVISESLAKEIAAAAKGASLEEAAKAKGLTVASLGLVTKADLATKSGPAVADAAFAAKQGALAGPAKGTLGWALVRVDAVDARPTRSLEQVKGEITTALAAEKRKAALGALTQKIDEQFSKGGALSDAAKDLGITLADTGAITADGHVFGQQGPQQASVPATIAPVVKAAFAMEHEGQPQITELVAGKSYVIYDVSHIDAAAPAPLDQIRGRIVADITLDKGNAAAKAAALKVLGEAKKGGQIAQLIGALGVALPPVQPIAMSRDKIPVQNGQIPPALGLFFAQAKGTTKLLPMPGNQGWFVVQVKDVIPGTVDPKDAALAQVAAELGQLTGREQGEALRRAIRAEVKVKRYDAGLKTVAGQLGGAN